MITSPSDERLIVHRSVSAQIVRGEVAVRARVWSDGIEKVTLTVDGGNAEVMDALDECTWSKLWDSSRHGDGSHVLTVAAAGSNGKAATDRVTVRVHRRGEYRPPVRRSIDYENALGEWPEKHILGTQLGPNENGRKWPSRRGHAPR